MFIISGGSDNAVKVWNITQGKCVKTLKGHSSSVWMMWPWSDVHLGLELLFFFWFLSHPLCIFGCRWCNVLTLPMDCSSFLHQMIRLWKFGISKQGNVSFFGHRVRWYVLQCFNGWKENCCWNWEGIFALVVCAFIHEPVHWISSTISGNHDTSSTHPRIPLLHHHLPHPVLLWHHLLLFLHHPSFLPNQLLHHHRYDVMWYFGSPLQNFRESESILASENAQLKAQLAEEQQKVILLKIGNK